MDMFYNVIYNAKNLYANRHNIIYALGGQGETLEKYFASGKGIYYNQCSLDEFCKKYNVKPTTLVYDCSGFVNACYGYPRNYTSNSYAKLAKLVESSRYGVHGAILHKDGHCGIDLGYGLCIHIPNYGHTIEIDLIANVGFTESIRMPDIEYDTVRIE